MFLHVHLAQATSRGLREVRSLGQDENVTIAGADLCVHGVRTKGKDGQSMPAKSCTRFVTNSTYIAEEIRKTYNTVPDHQDLINYRSQHMARYPEGLCKAIINGITKELSDKEREDWRKSLLAEDDEDSASEGEDEEGEGDEKDEEADERWRHS